MNRNKLYVFLSVAIAVGYGWIGYQLLTSGEHGHGAFTVCLIKNVTGMPCPSCGITRAVLSIMEGDFGSAFYLNPLGFLVAVILLIGPAWLICDVAFHKDSLWKNYRALENWLKNPSTAIPLALLVLINWFWNIYKGI